MAKVGRKSLLDTAPERISKMLEAIRDGAPVRDAAAWAGISQRVYFQWKEQALAARQRDLTAQRLSKRDRQLLQFLQQVEEAESAAVVLACQALSKLGATDWRAAAWKLEKLRPVEFGRVPQQVNHQVSGSVDMALIVQTRAQVVMDEPGFLQAARVRLVESDRHSAGDSFSADLGEDAVPEEVSGSPASGTH